MCRGGGWNWSNGRMPGGVHFFLLKAPAIAGVYIVQVKGENGMGVYLKWVVAGK